MPMKKRGLSGILAVVLMVLLAIIAVAIVWFFVRNSITSVGDQIFDDTVFTDVKFSIVGKTIFITSDGNTSFVTRREAGGGNVTGVLIILEDRARNRYSWFNLSRKGNVEVFESIPVYINRDEHKLGDIKKIIVHATLINKKGLLVVSSTPVASYTVPDFIQPNEVINGTQLYPDEGGSSGGSDGGDDGPPPPIQYTLTLLASHTERGTVSPAGETSHLAGTQVLISAVNNSGYDFAGWDNGIGIFELSPSTQVLMDSNKHITAVFTIKGSTLYTLTTQVEPPASGIVSKNPNQGTFEENSNVTLTAAPISENYRFVEWREGGILLGADNPINVTMNANRSITAIFEVQGGLLLSLSGNPDRGTVNATPDKTSYTLGEQVSIEAFPFEGYQFARWEENGALFNSSNPHVFAMQRNYVLEAIFANAGCYLSPEGYTDDCSDPACNGVDCIVDGELGECDIAVGACVVDGIIPHICGNGIVEPEIGEMCDGTNFGSIDFDQICQSQGYCSVEQETLQCNDCVDIVYFCTGIFGTDPDTCPNPNCGNGELDLFEQCDGTLYSDHEFLRQRCLDMGRCFPNFESTTCELCAYVNLVCDGSVGQDC